MKVVVCGKFGVGAVKFDRWLRKCEKTWQSVVNVLAFLFGGGG